MSDSPIIVTRTSSEEIHALRQLLIAQTARKWSCFRFVLPNCGTE